MTRLDDLNSEPDEQAIAAERAAERAIEDAISTGQSLIAEHLIKMFPDRFMFTPGIGWHRYDGTRWHHGNGLAEKELGQAVIRTARSLIRQSASETDDALRRSVQQAANRTLARASEVNGVIAFLSMHPHTLVPLERLNEDPWLFNARNGTLDLHTGQLRPHDPHDRITKVAGCDYHPQATSPTWERFLREALGDDNLIAAMARCFGGAGLPGIVYDHLLPIAYGPGGAGKGTFYSTVMAAMGEYAISGAPDLVTATKNAHPTAQMDLLGARLVIVSETDEGRQFAVATMKRLTGGDRIKARLMGKDFVEFDPSHLLVMVTNHLPTMTTGDDSGVWRRVRVIPFTNVPESADTHLGESLRTELPGVLAWLVRGHADYVQRGTMDWPEQVLTATDEYRSNADLIGAFLDDRTEQAPALVAATPIGQLFAAWKSWILDNAPDLRPGRPQDFAAKLRNHGEHVESSTGRGTRTIVRGRRLRAENESEEPQQWLDPRNAAPRSTSTGVFS